MHIRQYGAVVLRFDVGLPPFVSSTRSLPVESMSANNTCVHVCLPAGCLLSVQHASSHLCLPTGTESLLPAANHLLIVPAIAEYVTFAPPALSAFPNVLAWNVSHAISQNKAVQHMLSAKTRQCNRVTWHRIYTYS
jgi:hypothetical protein